MRIVNGQEIVVPPAGQRNLPVAIERVFAIADRPDPRTRRWSAQPTASSLRGRLFDLLV